MGGIIEGALAKNRIIQTEVKEAIVSTQRRRSNAVIPPFSFVGELEAGISGFWYPTSRIEVMTASVSAAGAGTASAVLSILVEEPGTNSPISIADLELLPTETKRIIQIDYATITPYDKVYVASWVESGHTGVVVQMVGQVVV